MTRIRCSENRLDGSVVAREKPLADALFLGGPQATLGQTYDQRGQSASELSSAHLDPLQGRCFSAITGRWHLSSSSVPCVRPGRSARSESGVDHRACLPAVAGAVRLFQTAACLHARRARVQDHIDGLRQYLGGERDDLARMKAPKYRLPNSRACCRMHSHSTSKKHGPIASLRYSARRLSRQQCRLTTTAM